MKSITKLKDILFIQFVVLSLFALQVYAQQYPVSGTVRYRDNNEIVTRGVVKAYDEFGGYITSTPINLNGTYTFSGLDPVLTDVIGFPNLEPEEEEDFIPTYYPNAQLSQYAVSILPDHPLTDIDIVVERTGGDYGFSTAFISGNITLNNKPVNDAIIHAKFGDVIVGYGVTSADGAFKIDEIPAGDYILVVHRVGAYVVNLNVKVTNDGLSNLDVNLERTRSQQNNNAGEFKLSQNYPNPFNPSTMISYSIGKTGNVNISVYNSAGQMVKELVNGYLNSGTYNVEFNGSGLASGIYYYKMITNGNTETRKMILIK
ncbi:MAG: T9SS C-terminal target domain-containing protein [Ignavibacteriae bacterium]|nr:MAG: T9SS C-terminal target domain-containing protein [Ignavibacteriota bacterium]